MELKRTNLWGHSAKSIITFFTILIVGLFFLFYGLATAKPFLAPLAVGILLAMVVLPAARWLEKIGLNRGWASFCATLLVLLFFVVLIGALSYQVKSFAQDWPQTRQQLEQKVDDLKNYIKDKTGITVDGRQKQIVSAVVGSPEGQQGQQDQLFSGGSPLKKYGNSLLSTAGSFLMSFVSLLGTFLLTLIYIFFFLLYRQKFKRSIAKWFPSERRPEVNKVVTDAANVSQNYLLGKLLLCVLIAILYAIGLSIAGIKHAILISVIASVLTLIPYIGNIIGFALAMAMAFVAGGSTTALIGVALTFGITQLLETYTLEPFVVGGKVNLNPIMTIIVVVLGYEVWGVVGMLIAIPALGVAKIIFDHVSSLNPLGYLFGNEDLGDDEESMADKAKNWASEKLDL